MPNILGAIRNFLQWPHRRLISSSNWYRQWHETPHHHATHRRIALHATLGTSAVVGAKTLAALSLVLGLQSNVLAGLSKTWTTQSDFNEYTHTNNVTTSGGTITLDSSGGAGSWGEVSGVPSLNSGWTDLSATSDSNIWIAEVDEVVQYNGTSWTTHNGLGAPGLHIGAVITFGSNDTWVFGDYGVASHWNGTAWTTSYLLIDGATPATFVSAGGTSSSNLWAGADGAIFYYNGSSWTQQISPGSCIGNFISISAASATDAWAANDAGWGSSGCASGWHYNGANWILATDAAPIGLSSIYSPTSGAAWTTDYIANTIYYTTGGTLNSYSVGTGNLKDIDGTSATDIWAVGTLGGGYNLTHYNGTTWTPGAATLADDLISVDVISTDSVYAISGSILYSYQASTVYDSSGTSTITYTPQAGQYNDWTTASVSSTTPTNTTVTTEYSHNNSTWVSDLSTVPSSESLYIKITLATTDTSVSPTIDSVTVNYDAITATVSSPASGSTNYANETTDSITIGWSTTGSAGADHVRVQYSTNSGGSWSDITGATGLAASSTSYIWDTPDITSSAIRIKVILEDASNNALANDTTDADFSLVYDTTAPTLSISVSTSGSSSTTAYPGETITLSITSDEALASTPTATIGGLSTTCTGSSTSWSCARTVGDSDPTGSQTISVSGQDAAGNTGTNSTNTISIQHVVPPIVVDPQAPLSTPSNVKIYTSTSAITLTYSQPSGGDTIRIWRSTNSSETGTLLTTTNQIKYTDTSVTLGTTYYYRLATYRASEDRESAKVTVQATPPAEIGWGIIISPKVISLKPGASTQLTATVYDSFGRQQVVPINWSTDSRAGTITSGGLFTASQNTGDYREGIVASANYQGIGGRGSVPVYVDSSDNRVVLVTLNQNAVTLKPGASFTFSLVAYNQNGASLAIDPSKVSWTTTVGTMSGSRLTAGTKNGTVDNAVTATFTDPSGQIWKTNATVTITGETPYLYQISLTGHQRVPTNSDARYYSYAYDQFNSRINGGEATIFSISEPQAGKIDSIGRLHTGSEEGCYYWSISASKTISGRTSNARSGVLTKPYTESERQFLDNRILFGWRQVRFTHKPGGSYSFIGIIYDGWGKIRPHSAVEFRLADSRLGEITTNGQYIAGTETGIYPRGLEVYFHDLNTGAKTLYGRYTLVISEEDTRPSIISTRSVKTGPESAIYTTLNAYDQFGLVYTGSYVKQFSLGSSNSRIEQSGLIETGAPEDSRNVIFGRINTGLTTNAAAQGNILASSESALSCSTTGTVIPPGGDVIDEDGNTVIFLDPEDAIQAGSVAAQATDNPPQSTGTPRQETLRVNLPNNNSKPSTNWPETTANWVEKLLVPLSVLAILSTVPTLAAGLLQMISQLLSRFAASLTNALQAFTAFRRPRPFGKVVDGRTNKPVAGATVQLFAADTRRVIDVRRTDLNGQYVFLVDSRQTAILSVIAANFKPYEKLVRGENVHRIVRLGVQLEHDEKTLKNRQLWQRIFRLIESSRTTLLVLGTIAWVATVLNYVTPTLFYIGYYYLFAWLLEWYIAQLPRPYGVVKDALTNTPLNQVVVRIINRRQKLVGTEITNARGQFRTLLRPGVYTFTYSKAGYETTNHFGAILPKTARSFRVDASMNRQSPIR